MDGPNVNLKFYKNFKTRVLSEVTGVAWCGDMFSAQCTQFIQTCNSCNWVGYWGHTQCLPYSDFVSITGSTIFPKKFCPHQWVENVATRALEVIPHLIKFVKTVEGDKRFTTPKCKKFLAVKAACNDKLLPAKLHFFIFVAKHVQSYLQKYQTDSPMVPFLTKDWTEMVCNIMSTVLKPSVIESMKDPVTNAKYTVTDEDTLSTSKVDVGFLTARALKLQAGKVGKRSFWEFSSDAKKCQIELLKWLLDKSPVQSSFVPQTSCLNPQLVENSLEVCVKKFTRLLNHLLDLKRCTEPKCEDDLRQYKAFVDIPANSKVVKKVIC